MDKKGIRKNTKNTLKTGKQERRLERELLWVLGFAVFLVFVFTTASSYFKSLNQVQYGSLTFTKEKFGDIPVYHYSYTFKTPITGKVINYNMYLRNDPTENNVPVEGQIKFEGSKAYITLDTSYLEECPKALVAIGALTQYMVDNQFNVQSGNMDFTEAAVRNQEYVTCENKKGINVIQVLRGEETGIIADNQCISIVVGPDCRLLEAVEKFEVQSFLDAQAK